jgi:hypothetical protein
VQDVVPLRIVAIKKFCRLGVGTADDLANILLNSLTPILLEYERMANEQVQGALQTVWSLSYSHPPQEYELRFLDDLARQRDQLWMKERIMEDPAVAALNQGWPRGLPVQFLYPSMEWATAAVANAESAPFMAARVKDVVFCDVDVVLTKVQQSDTAAIGPFCDSLPFAMRAYIGGKHQVDREARLLKIWEHYSSPKWTSTSHIQKFKTWLMDFAKLCKFTHAVAVLDPLEYATLHYENFFATGPGPMEWDPRPRGSKYPEEHAQSSSTHSTDDSSYTLLQCQFHTAIVSWVSRGAAFQRPSPWQNLSGRDGSRISICEDYQNKPEKQWSYQQSFFSMLFYALARLASCRSHSQRLLHGHGIRQCIWIMSFSRKPLPHAMASPVPYKSFKNS